MSLKRRFCLVALALHSACLLPGLQADSKSEPSITAELQSLQGRWEGFALNPESLDGPPVIPSERVVITIKGDSFHFHRDANFWFETTIVLPAGVHPRQLHATIKDNAPSQGKSAIGKVVVALFKIEGETLTLAARGDGADDTPLAFEGENVTRYELRKVPPPEKSDASPKPK